MRPKINIRNKTLREAVSAPANRLINATSHSDAARRYGAGLTLAYNHESLAYLWIYCLGIKSRWLRGMIVKTTIDIEDEFNTGPLSMLMKEIISVDFRIEPYIRKATAGTRYADTVRTEQNPQ